MISSPVNVKNARVFYGWVALAGVMLTAFVAGGAFMYSYGVFLPVMSAEFGWSRAVMSAGLSLGLLAFGVPSLLSGFLVARFGPRLNVIWGNLLAVFGLAGMSLVTQVWHVYVLYGLVGLGAGIGGYVACTTVANNWFVKRRALAMGLFGAGAGLGGFVFPPLVTVIIDSFGWREAWLALAGIVFVMVVLVAGVIMVRNRPEDAGMVPDGLSLTPFDGRGEGESRAEAPRQPEGWPARRAMLLPVTWLLAVFTAANYFALGTMIAHQVAYVRDLGYTPVAAALTMSLASGIGLFGRLGYGVAALRFDVRHLAITGVLLQLVALGILLATGDLGYIYLYAILFGISNGMLFTAMPTIVGEYFGRAAFARATGVILAVGLTIEAMAPVVAGAIYDATSGYKIAFIVVAAFSLVGLVSIFLARKPGALNR